jgi:hypothetical protein
MNRIFGRGKPKEPPPNINDCIAGVSVTVFVYVLLSAVRFVSKYVIKFVLRRTAVQQY